MSASRRRSGAKCRSRAVGRSSQGLPLRWRRPAMRPKSPEHDLLRGVVFDRWCHGNSWHYRHLRRNEVPMATRRHGQIVETPTEARQAEPGPSVLALLTVSTGLAVLILGIVWFVFFRT